MIFHKEIIKRVFKLAKKHGKKVFSVVGNMSIALERRDFLQSIDCFVCNIQEAGLLFLDDYTGKTPEEMVNILKKEGAAEIKVCTLLFKPQAYRKDIKIDYAALQIPNDFIVGYGLDYNQLGRQYKDIYVLDEE